MILCVTGSPQIEEIVYGENGIMSAARDGLIVVDTSTAEPASTAKIRDDFAKKGALYVDAPLARTPKEAEEGRLNTMVGADDATFAKLKPVLSAYCENVIHVGPPGHGHMLKLVNNFIAQAIATATAEACAACAKSGVSIKKLHEVISAGAVNSGIFQMMVGKMLEGGDLSGLKFTLVNAMKDLRYYTHFAESAAGPGDRRRSRASEPCHREPARLRRQIRRVADRGAGKARRREDRLKGRHGKCRNAVALGQPARNRRIRVRRVRRTGSGGARPSVRAAGLHCGR